MRLFIFGNGGFAREIWAYAAENPEGLFLDNRKAGKPDSIIFVGNASEENLPHGVTLLDESEYDSEHARGGCSTIIGTGLCDVKKEMLAEAKAPFAKYIHPKSYCSGSARVGEGSVIAPLSAVAPLAVISRHVLVNYGATIGHHAVVGPGSVVLPNSSIGGKCNIGEFVSVGAGAMIREGLTIGDNSIIGMGSVITKDVPADSVALGVNNIMAIEDWKLSSSSSEGG